MRPIYLILLMCAALSSYSQQPVAYDTTEEVMLGGIRQFISIKGYDSEAPILLFLHGGPGSSLMPVAERLTDSLQTAFLVVIWDQRETGTTASLNTSDQELTHQLFQQDTYELIQYLLAKLHRKKLYLVSHSWGSVLGFEMALKHPELLHAYIPISPIIDQEAAARLTVKMLQKRARRENNETALRELAQVKIPFESQDDLFYSQKWLFIHNGVDFATKEDFKEKYYAWMATWFPMWKASVEQSLFETIPEIDCPIYFFEGNYDKQKSHNLVRSYCRRLKAPKKQFFWFRRSGHTIFNTEPEKIQRLLIEIILPQTQGLN